jgi:hypothetical protein
MGDHITGISEVLKLIAKNILTGFYNPIVSAWMTGITVVLVASIFRKSQQKRREDLIVAIGYCVYSAVGIQLQSLVIWLRPHTYDRQLLAIDRFLGFNPIDVSYMWTHHTYFMLVLYFGYGLTPLFLVLLWLERQSKVYRDAILISGIAIWFLFLLCPACGPIYYLSGNMQGAWRDCLPSMHMAWALFMPINARNLWLKAVLWIYAVMIAAATVCLGEHYYIDLIAAVPFVWASQFFSKVWNARKHMRDCGSAPVLPKSHTQSNGLKCFLHHRCDLRMPSRSERQ